MNTQEQTTLTPPSCVTDKLKELTAICEENPVQIPLPVAAKFLGMESPSLRAAIMDGSCPFGFGWRRTARGNRAFCIPTHLFYICNAPVFGMRTTYQQAVMADRQFDFVGAPV